MGYRGLETELAYMAGIIDGEGSICLIPHRSKSRGKFYYRYRPNLSVSSTSESLVLWIEKRFGGHIRFIGKRKENWNATYQWECSHTVALSIIRLYLPYLVIKREQALLFSEFMGTSTRGGKRISESLASKRRDIALKVSDLNRSGKKRHAVVNKGFYAPHAESQNSETEKAMEGCGQSRPF